MIAASITWLCAALFVLVALPSSAAAETPLERCSTGAAARIDIRPCLEARLVIAEASLSAAESAVADEMTELHELTGRDGAARAFRQTRAEFKRYRASHCGWIRVRAEPGTGAGDFELDCLILMTEQRAAELQDDSRLAETE